LWKNHFNNGKNMSHDIPIVSIMNELPKQH